MALTFAVMSNGVIAASSSPLAETMKQLDRLDQGCGETEKNNAVANQLHELRRQLEDLRWKSAGGERLMVCVQIARVLRLQKDYSQAELELKSNASTFRLYDEQSRRDSAPECSPLPYALYEFGKIYQAQAEKDADDIETTVAYNVRALKQYYRILKEYPTHPLKIKTGAEMLVCKSRLERLIEADIPLPDIVIPRQSNSLDELTPADINRMLEDRKYAEALPLLQAVANENQDDKRLAGTLLKIALTHAHLGQDDQCVSVIERLARRYKNAPQTGEALAICGRILWEKDKKAAAVRIFAMFPVVAPSHPRSGPLALLAAREYLTGGDDDRALILCDKIINSCKGSVAIKDAHNLVGGILLRARKYQDAARHFQRFAEQEKDNPYKQRSARYLAAYSLFCTGDAENGKNAGKIIEGILAEKAKDDVRRKSLLLLAAIREQTGDLAGAAKQYEKFRVGFPGDAKQPEICLRLCSLYCRQKDTDKSVRMLEQLTANYPTSDEAVNARFNLGRMLYEDGEYAQSVKYFRELLDGQGAIKVSQLLWLNEHSAAGEEQSVSLSGTALSAGKKLLALIDGPAVNSDPQLIRIKNNPAIGKEILFNTAKAAFVCGDYRLALTCLDRVLSSHEVATYYEVKILRAQTRLALKEVEPARQDFSEAAIAALQENRLEEYSRIQCMVADTYIADGNFRKSYGVLKLLDSPSTPEQWREYAIFQASVCARKLSLNQEFTTLKDKYLELFPNGKFLKEIESN